MEVTQDMLRSTTKRAQYMMKVRVSVYRAHARVLKRGDRQTQAAATQARHAHAPRQAAPGPTERKRTERKPTKSRKKLRLPQSGRRRGLASVAGRGGAAYTSDAVDRHLCSLRVPCERERRTARAQLAAAAPAPPPAPPPGPPPAPPPAAPGAPAAAPPAPAAAPPAAPPGPFIYNTTHAPSPTTPRRTRRPQWRGNSTPPGGVEGDDPGPSPFYTRLHTRRPRKPFPLSTRILVERDLCATYSHVSDRGSR
ncbi:unnamed protein product [Arctia plantaginis]|uniref:Uncharacterized protein n=1 Tax=Arctia plantaginis TaxID=874455 RepID=A0A8S1B5J3_ARCPL|nr:unnamed protein product [Arctia plantaginis]